MKIVKYDKFLETALSIPLLKTIRNGKERGNTLVDKLEDPNPKLKLNYYPYYTMQSHLLDCFLVLNHNI